MVALFDVSKLTLSIFRSELAKVSVRPDSPKSGVFMLRSSVKAWRMRSSVRMRAESGFPSMATMLSPQPVSWPLWPLSPREIRKIL